MLSNRQNPLPTVICQGDFILIEKSIPEGAKLEENQRKITLAGETGRVHEMVADKIYRTENGQVYVQVDKSTRITHADHPTVIVPRGEYMVTRNRDYERPHTAGQRIPQGD